MNVVKAARAWVIFVVVIALPSALSIVIALRSGERDAQSMRAEAYEERIAAASKLRVLLELASTRAEEVLRSWPRDAAVAELEWRLEQADVPLATAYLVTHGRELVLAGRDAGQRETLRPILLATPALPPGVIMQTKNQFWFRVGLVDNRTSTLATGDGSAAVVSRAFDAVDEGGFIIDTGSFVNGARRVLPAWLTVEKRPDPPSIGAAPREVAFRRFVSRTPATNETTVFVGRDATFEVVPVDSANLERQIRWRRSIILLNWLVPLTIFIAVATSLFVRSRRAQRLADLRTDFVAAVSHELRTPLASVRMFAELLEAKAVPPDERGEIERALADETRRLHGTLERMLRFGALARGKMNADRVEARLEPILREAAERFAVRHPVVIEVDANAVAAVDAGLLKHALENLIGNAVKYAPDSGPILVRARVADEVVIDVIDRGPGLDRRALRRVFLPFERADDRLSRATEGTGVGLALVRGIARAHGGDASVTSEPGRGSAFTLRFPSR
jgi:signal transduction histidine kinase